MLPVPHPRFHLPNARIVLYPELSALFRLACILYTSPRDRYNVPTELYMRPSIPTRGGSHNRGGSRNRTRGIHLPHQLIIPINASPLHHSSSNASTTPTPDTIVRSPLLLSPPSTLTTLRTQLHSPKEENTKHDHRHDVDQPLQRSRGDRYAPHRRVPLHRRKREPCNAVNGSCLCLPGSKDEATRIIRNENGKGWESLVVGIWGSVGIWEHGQSEADDAGAGAAWWKVLYTSVCEPLI